MKFFCAFFTALLFGSGLYAQSASVTVHFVFLFQGKPLESGKTYTTVSGEPIQLEQVRFYVGEPYAVAADGRPPELNSATGYWLIDSKDSASLHLNFPVESGLSFSGIAFRIGVDSINQVRGARTGALDPLKGMYWTWNSGYVAVKIEGKSFSAATAGRQLEYHLGGYRAPYPARTQINLISSKPFTVPAQVTDHVTVPIELDKFFPAGFSVKKMPTMMTPGPMVKQLMQQFKACFLPAVLGKPDL